MRDIIKKWWFWVIILIVIIILITLLYQKQKTKTAGISIEEYNEIDIGMTQTEVNKIIDKLDEWDNDKIYNKFCEEIKASNKDSIYTYEYRYYGERDGYAVITYEVDYSNGYYGLQYPTVVKKEKFNLK